VNGKMNGIIDENDDMKPLIDQILDYESGDYAQLLLANGEGPAAKLQSVNILKINSSLNYEKKR
jgi:hypothetical protein